jgi:hypothetical protein
MKARPSDPFVGRARELAELERALDAARSGTGATVLVAGDAGIGKTRLASELASRADDAGFEVLLGRSIDLVGTELPHQPLLVLALGIVIGIAATHRQDAASTAPTTAAPVVTPPPAPPETVIRTKTSVPDACLDTAQLADEIIARLNRNQRDNRLFLALRDYTIASQACREASP